jgi:UDP-glucose 4-epimerase
MTEWLLDDLERSGKSDMRHVILRYFNVAGAKVGGGLGLATSLSTQLIKVACEVALGKKLGLKSLAKTIPLLTEPAFVTSFM